MLLLYTLAFASAGPTVTVSSGRKRGVNENPEPLCPWYQCEINSAICFGKAAHECQFMKKHPDLSSKIGRDGHVCVNTSTKEVHLDSCEGEAVCRFDPDVGDSYFKCKSGRRRQEIPRQDEEGIAEEEEGIIVPGGVSADSSDSCSFLQRLFNNCPPPSPQPAGPGFQCRLGRIIPLAGKCNGKCDCDDCSDETPTWGCKPTITGPTWQCRGGKLIPLAAKCNGIRDCDDGSDEDTGFMGGCSSIGGGVVNGRTFRCRSGGFVRGWQRCNGRCECADCSDESRQYASCFPVNIGRR